MFTYREENKKLRKELKAERLKVAERDKLIKIQTEANAELRTENEELHDVLKRVEVLTEINKYNAEENIFGKIKELVHDCNHKTNSK